MKNILLHINDDEAAEARFQVALDLARARQGHITCLQVTPLTAYVASDSFGGIFLMPEVVDAVQKRAAKLRADTEARLAREDVCWSYEHCDGEPGQTVVTRARLADVVVLSRAVRQPRQGYLLPLAAAVATSARAPVLAVPADAKRFDATGRALVAWNGSAEAANALKAALPMLEGASAIDVVTISEREPAFPAVDACEYLSRHSLKSEIYPLELDQRTVGDLLLEAVEELESAYVVMGAYGHSRAREFLLGGATRQMLTDSPVPLLMTH